MYGAAFYTNICKLLSTLHGGIKHQRPTVKLPLSKVGLELSRVLTNLGIIEDFTIGQRLSHVRAHSRLWDPARTHIERSADAAGYPAMYLTLHLNYDKHKPLWCRTPLAAAPHTPPLPFALTSSSSSSLLPSAQHFTPPLGLNSPTPESVKIISKPSVQRCLSLQELLSKRRDMRPGIFLISTNQGLLTDIDCELRGIGGVVLAHLGLPLGQVVQLRGLLRSKYLAELAAALPAGSTAAGASEQDLLRAKYHAQHVPLAEWDARAAAVNGLAERVQQQVGPGMQLIMEQEQRFDDDINAARKARQTGRFDPAQPWQLLQEAQQRLAQLELQGSAWLQRGAGARGHDREDRGGASRSSSGSRGRVGGPRAGGEGRQGSGSGRQALFDQQRQQGSSDGPHDRWTPSSDS